MPSKWWEKIRLSTNYSKALEQVDDRLKYWPKFLVHRNKQRLTRLTQVRVRMQKLAREEERLGEQLVPRLAPKIRRREQTRERKAESAAKIERAIERELVERLRSGAYGDQPLNVDENIWKRVMRTLERGGEATRDDDLDEGIDEDEEEYEYEQEEEGPDVEYVSDVEESDDDMDDLEDWLGSEQEADSDDDEEDDEDDESGSEADDKELAKKLADLKKKKAPAPDKKSSKKKAGSKGPKREIEYEYERPAREMDIAK
jgi:protein MAK16